MAHRLNNIKDSFVVDPPNKLQSLRQATKLDAADLKTALYLQDNYDKYVKTGFKFFD